MSNNGEDREGKIVPGPNGHPNCGQGRKGWNFALWPPILERGVGCSGGTKVLANSQKKQK